MNVLGLIPARGGSKGVPGKNIRPLCGKPLLQYTAEAALAVRRLTKVVLSTDDPEIASVGIRCGLDVPFRRPPELAQDNTPTLPVVQHALAWLEDHGKRFDAVCLLQPTSPLRLPQQIDECIALLEESGVDSVITILSVPATYNPHWVYFPGEDDLLRLSTGESEPVSRRQELPPAFHREGSVYVVRRDIVMEHNSLYGDRTLGYLVDPERSVNLDSFEDWARAEELIKRLGMSDPSLGIAGR